MSDPGEGQAGPGAESGHMLERQPHSRDPESGFCLACLLRAELGHAQTALRASEAALAEARQETEDEITAALKLGDLLRRTCDALKGPHPDPLTLHSWHDLPETAIALHANVEAAHAEATKAERRTPRHRYVMHLKRIILNRQAEADAYRGVLTARRAERAELFEIAKEAARLDGCVCHLIVNGMCLKHRAEAAIRAPRPLVQTGPGPFDVVCELPSIHDSRIPNAPPSEEPRAEHAVWCHASCNTTLAVEHNCGSRCICSGLPPVPSSEPAREEPGR